MKSKFTLTAFGAFVYFGFPATLCICVNNKGKICSVFFFLTNWHLCICNTLWQHFDTKVFPNFGWNSAVVYTLSSQDHRKGGSRPSFKGWGAVSKKFFSTLRVSVWSKIKGGGGGPPPGPLPWISHCTVNAWWDMSRQETRHIKRLNKRF